MRSPSMTMVFAAGFGTRMGSLTKSRPKPLIEVAGRSLLDRALQLTQDANTHSFVNAHYKSEMLEAHLKDRPNVEVLVEQPNILDTGGGLKAALPKLGNTPVFTLNSDAVWAGPNPLEILRAAWRPEHMKALLLLIPIASTVGYSRSGNFTVDARGCLSRSPSGLVYTGAQILHTGGLESIPEQSFSLNRLWDQMLPKNQVFGVQYPGRWADVGTPEGIPLAEQMLEQHADV